jgi:hypothetical protein
MTDMDALLALWLGFTGYCLFSIRLSLARLVKQLEDAALREKHTGRPDVHA